MKNGPTLKRITSAILLLVGVLALPSCVGLKPLVSIATLPDSPELAKSRAERDANPTSFELNIQVITAALEDRRYALAFDEAQKLREQHPEDALVLYLLGRACHGMGLFDEAIASYFASVQKKPSEPATYLLAVLLRAKGRSDLALEILTDATRVLPNLWLLEELKSEVMPTREDRVAVLERFLAQHPKHEEASVQLQALTAPALVQRPLKIVQGANEVIRTKLNDYYNLPLNIVGHEVYTRLSLRGEHLQLSERAARELGIVGTGIKGPTYAKDWTTELAVIPRVQIGSLVLENVPTMIQRGLYHRTEVFAELPMSLLNGYVWRLDRKNEVLELFPPSQPVPAAGAKAKVQPYFDFGDRVVTAAILSNGRGKETIQTKVLLDTTLESSLLNSSYVREYSLGKLDTTRTTSQLQVVGGVSDFSVPVFAENATIQFGGATFLGDRTQDGFFAANLGTKGYFAEAAWIGKDVLSRFLITVNPNQHTLTLELY